MPAVPGPAPAPAPARADRLLAAGIVRFDLDGERSRVLIHATSSVHPIETAAPITGWLDVSLVEDGSVDLTAPVAARVQVPLQGLRSGNPLIDREADRRLDTRRHPTVSGELRSLEPGPAGGWRGRGDLTLHGITAPIEGTLRVDRRDDELGLTGSTTLLVTDFDVQPPSLLLVKVHPTVRVDLDAVARLAPGPRDGGT